MEHAEQRSVDEEGRTFCALPEYLVAHISLVLQLVVPDTVSDESAAQAMVSRVS